MHSSHQIRKCKSHNNINKSAGSIICNVITFLAKTKKAFSLAEEVIVPVTAVLTETMVDEVTLAKIGTVRLSKEN